MAKFEKGRSGNPGGRPKDADGLSELARNHSTHAMTKLIAYMDHRDPQIALKAISAVLDRALGKPLVGAKLESAANSVIVEIVHFANH